MTSVHFPVPIETGALEPGDFFTLTYGTGRWVCLCVKFTDETAALVLSSSTADEQTPFVVPMTNVRGWAQRIGGDFTFRPTDAALAFPRRDGWATPGCLSVTPEGRAYLRPAGRGGWGRGHYCVQDGQELAHLPDGSAHYPSWELLWEADSGASRKPEVIASLIGPSE